MKTKIKFFISLLSALLLILSWPEKGISFLIFIAWLPLFYLSDYFQNNPKEKFFPWIYLTFFLFNLLTTYWIWFATPVGAVIAVTVNSFLMAAVFWIWHKFRSRLPDKMAWALFPALWISFEKLHYVWDLEWPWLTMGNVFATVPKWVQWYEYTGVFGGTLWVLATNIQLFRFWQQKKKIHLIKAALWLFIPLAISMVIWNQYREKGKNARVLILQPNIDPWTEKFNRPNAENIRDLIELSRPYLDSTDLVVAPETALANSIEIKSLNGKKIFKDFNQFRKKFQHTDWLVGASLYRFVDPGKEKISQTAIKGSFNNWYELYNSAVFYTSDSQPQLYHKKILVVGAEKMPFHKFLSPLIGDIVLDLGGATGTLTPSPEPVVFKSKNNSIRVAPIICYESIFGDYVRQFVLKKANLLAVITNDGWWKKTGGYRQHFHYARLRAIETRRDIVRSANTGRSGHINQKGEVVAQLDYNKRGVLFVTPRLNEEITFYTRFGDFISRIALFILIILFVYGLGKKRSVLKF